MNARLLLLLLVILGLTGLGCTVNRGGRGGGSNDDDASADDDDSAGGDDDDLTGDDDDLTGDDDDDDDDDDDSTAPPTPGQLIMSTSNTNFGNSGVGVSVARTVSLTNPGGLPVNFSLDLTWDLNNVFVLSGGATGAVPGGGSVTRTVTYTPDMVAAQFTSLVAVHDGLGDNPQILYLRGTGGGAATESACNNGSDDDGDGYIDCDDWDCIGLPGCGDPCCRSMPWPGSNAMCDSASTLACLCSVDPYCCESGWNVFCIDTYLGNGACSAAPTCPN